MAKYFLGFKYVNLCVSCGKELPYILTKPSSSETFFTSLDLRDKFQNCKNCGKIYDSNPYNENISFEDFMFFDKVFYLSGLVVNPSIKGILEIHEDPNLKIFILYFLAPIYWMFLFSLNLFLLFPFRIPFRIIKALRFRKNHYDTSDIFKKKYSYSTYLFNSYFYIFSILFVPLIVYFPPDENYIVEIIAIISISLIPLTILMIPLIKDIIITLYASKNKKYRDVSSRQNKKPTFFIKSKLIIDNFFYKNKNSLQTKLMELSKLKEMGLITESEYQIKKNQLLEKY